MRGQALGLAMLVTPAITHPLPLGAVHGAVQLLAVIVGSAGMVVVFGGLFLRTFVQPSTGTLDDALLAVPHTRAAWLGLALSCAVLTIGAVWCLVLAFDHDWAERFANALLLGLPAMVLGAAAWRARVMWTGPATEAVSAA